MKSRAASPSKSVEQGRNFRKSWTCVLALCGVPCFQAILSTTWRPLHAIESYADSVTMPCDADQNATITQTVPATKPNSTNHQSVLERPFSNQQVRKSSPQVHWAHAEIFHPGMNETNRLCFPWTLNIDSWWTHNPEWKIWNETDTKFCFSRDPKDRSGRTQYLRRLHDLQFIRGDCKNVYTKYMWKSGFGADMNNLVDGLLHGLATDRPFQVTFKPEFSTSWHYAALKDGSRPVCHTKDMFCYFLPLGACQPGTEIDEAAFAEELPGDIPKQWLLEYMIRPHQWLRRLVYENLRDNGPHMREKRCAVIHVRRSDVVLHADWSRKYYAISDYLKKLRKSDYKYREILLLTDDANAVEEAQEFHPEYKWKFFKRKRFRGSEGGWENQLPSKDPLDEMVTLLSTFRVVQECDAIVNGFGTFAQFLHLFMKSSGKGIEHFRVDEDNPDEVLSKKNIRSDEVLETRLANARKSKMKGDQKSGK